MAPLERRSADLSLQGTVAIIVLVITFLSGIFCTIIFFKICSKQRRRERAMRRMQEERTPFVGAQYIAPAGAPAGAPSNDQEPIPAELHNEQRYVYTGPLELQGAVRPEPLPAQQLDGYTAAVCAIIVGISDENLRADMLQPKFDDSKPVELPANAMANDANGKVLRQK
jgi:hypothetical protein